MEAALLHLALSLSGAGVCFVLVGSSLVAGERRRFYRPDLAPLYSMGTRNSLRVSGSIFGPFTSCFWFEDEVIRGL